MAGKTTQGRSLDGLRQEMAYGHKVTLEGVKFIYRSASCLMVLSARTDKGAAVVAFIEGHDADTALEYAFDTCRSSAAPLKWRADTYRN